MGRQNDFIHEKIRLNIYISIKTHTANKKVKSILNIPKYADKLALFTRKKPNQQLYTDVQTANLH